MPVEKIRAQRQVIAMSHEGHYREAHPLIFVFTHWINLVCMICLAFTGFYIHYPFFAGFMNTARTNFETDRFGHITGSDTTEDCTLSIRNRLAGAIALEWTETVLSTPDFPASRMLPKNAARSWPGVLGEAGLRVSRS